MPALSPTTAVTSGPANTLLLLHLPPPPSSASPHSVTTYYRPAVSAFPTYYHNTPTQAPTQALPSPLTIAVNVPYATPNPASRFTRAAYVDQTQRMLTAVYSLTSAREWEDVDVRVVFYWDDCGSSDSRKRRERVIGPVFPLSQVLQAADGWGGEVVWVVEKGREEGVQRIEGGGETEGKGKKTVVLQVDVEIPRELKGEADGEKVQENDSDGSAEDDGRDWRERRHSVVAVGGTFDHLHAGHKLLLTTAAFLIDQPSPPSSSSQLSSLPPSSPKEQNLSRRLIVGLTGPALLATKKHAEYLLPWSVRAKDVLDFLAAVMLLIPVPLPVPEEPEIPPSSSLSPLPPSSPSTSHYITQTQTQTQNSSDANAPHSSEPKTISTTTITTTIPPTHNNLLTTFCPPPHPPSSFPSSSSPLPPSTSTATSSQPTPHPIGIQITEINDPYGPTITDPLVDALVVSEETRKGGDMVNVERRKKGWKGLGLFVVGVVMESGSEEGEKMSSTERRRREDKGRKGRGDRL